MSMKCYSAKSENLGPIIAFEEHRPGSEQEVVHVMCSARDSNGGPAAVGSVERPSTWEPTCVG